MKELNDQVRQAIRVIATCLAHRETQPETVLTKLFLNCVIPVYQPASIFTNQSASADSASVSSSSSSPSSVSRLPQELATFYQYLLDDTENHSTTTLVDKIQALLNTSLPPCLKTVFQAFFIWQPNLSSQLSESQREHLIIDLYPAYDEFHEREHQHDQQFLQKAWNETLSVIPETAMYLHQYGAEDEIKVLFSGKPENKPHDEIIKKWRIILEKRHASCFPSTLQIPVLYQKVNLLLRSGNSIHAQRRDIFLKNIITDVESEPRLALAFIKLLHLAPQYLFVPRNSLGCAQENIPFWRWFCRFFDSLCRDSLSSSSKKKFCLSMALLHKIWKRIYDQFEPIPGKVGSAHLVYLINIEFQKAYFSEQESQPATQGKAEAKHPETLMKKATEVLYDILSSGKLHGIVTTFITYHSEFRAPFLEEFINKTLANIQLEPHSITIPGFRRDYASAYNELSPFFQENPSLVEEQLSKICETLLGKFNLSHMNLLQALTSSLRFEQLENLRQRYLSRKDLKLDEKYLMLTTLYPYYGAAEFSKIGPSLENLLFSHCSAGGEVIPEILPLVAKWILLHVEDRFSLFCPQYPVARLSLETSNLSSFTFFKSADLGLSQSTSSSSSSTSIATTSSALQQSQAILDWVAKIKSSSHKVAVQRDLGHEITEKYGSKIQKHDLSLLLALIDTLTEQFVACPEDNENAKLLIQFMDYFGKLPIKDSVTIFQKQMRKNNPWPVKRSLAWVTTEPKKNEPQIFCSLVAPLPYFFEEGEAKQWVMQLSTLSDTLEEGDFAAKYWIKYHFISLFAESNESEKIQNPIERQECRQYLLSRYGTTILDIENKRGRLLLSLQERQQYVVKRLIPYDDLQMHPTFSFEPDTHAPINFYNFNTDILEWESLEMTAIPHSQRISLFCYVMLAYKHNKDKDWTNFFAYRDKVLKYLEKCFHQDSLRPTEQFFLLTVLEACGKRESVFNDLQLKLLGQWRHYGHYAAYRELQKIELPDHRKLPDEVVKTVMSFRL